VTPQEFLKAVLPPEGYGYYCVAELSSKRKQHIFDKTIEGIAERANLFDNKQQDTYFAVATFENDNGREASNARWVKSFFVDIDCGVGHSYPDAKAGAIALTSFVADTGLCTLPSPIVVASGRGVHAYWPLTEPVSVFAWKLVAERLKRLATEKQFRIDHTVSADAARVMRDTERRIGRGTRPPAAPIPPILGIFGRITGAVGGLLWPSEIADSTLTDSQPPQAERAYEA